jgi:predicted transcriptional regulator
MSEWTLFSNYGHVLIFLAQNPKARLRDVADSIGITERAVQKIVHDLQAADFITIRKQGRRNNYKINRNSQGKEDLRA